MKETCGDGDNDHAQALRATVAEHKQHMANIQVDNIPFLPPMR